ncbi:hypothetical protein V8G54_008982, partial [Vigna mungo]
MSLCISLESLGSVMYKNLFQEFTSRSDIDLPVYQTFNEGESHIPKFWSIVWVAQISYTSESKFPQKRAVEQEVARLALETILENTRVEGTFIVNEISPLCKCIINEYASKLHIEGTSYDTLQQILGGVLPIFRSSLFFNGTRYTGDLARTKKDVEQSATQAVILSIMAIKGKGLSLLQASEVLSKPNSKDISITLDPKEAVVPDFVADKGEDKVEHTKSSIIHSTCQKQESSIQATLRLHP